MEKHLDQFESTTRITACDYEYPAVERRNIIFSERRRRGELRANKRNNASHVEHEVGISNTYVRQRNGFFGDPR